MLWRSPRVAVIRWAAAFLTCVVDVLAHVETAGEAVVGDGYSDDDAERASWGLPVVGCGVPERQWTLRARRVDDKPHRPGVPGLEGDPGEADQSLRGLTCCSG